MDRRVQELLHAVIASVWCLELLLLLRRSPSTPSSPADLVTELRSSRVIVCPALAGACPGTAAAWDGGWSIVAIPAAGAASILIAQDVAPTQGVTVRGNRPVADYVSYTSLGYARRLDGALQMGTFTVCRPGHKLRKVILANSGRARIDETAEECP